MKNLNTIMLALLISAMTMSHANSQTSQEHKVLFDAALADYHNQQKGKVESAICVGAQGLQNVELKDPYMTVSRVNVRDSIKSVLKKRSSFIYVNGGVIVENQAWKYTRLPEGTVLKNISFGDDYLCRSSKD